VNVQKIRDDLQAYLDEIRLDGYADRQLYANQRIQSYELSESQVATYQDRVQSINDRMDAWLRDRKIVGRPYR
jgi:hypothetical protein